MLKGKLSIGRYKSNVRPDVIYIKVTDELSGTPFIEIEVAPENFALALTGLSLMDCDFETRGLNRIGKQRDMKSELIWVTYHNKTAEMYEAMKEAAKPYEVDGWQALINKNSRIEPHDRSPSQWEIAVTFVRYVTITPDTTSQSD